MPSIGSKIYYREKVSKKIFRIERKPYVQINSSNLKKHIELLENRKYKLIFRNHRGMIYKWVYRTVEYYVFILNGD